MPRRTRKQIVGKRTENAEQAENDRLLRVLQRLVRREWWSQQRGQIPASEVLPLCPHARREREQARRDFLAMDPFEHREE